MSPFKTISKIKKILEREKGGVGGGGVNNGQTSYPGEGIVITPNHCMK